MLKISLGNDPRTKTAKIDLKDHFQAVKSSKPN